MSANSSILLTCPHCGATKRVAISKTKWYNTKYTFWSDCRIDCDEWQEPSHTQLCSTCGKFFTLPPAHTFKEEDIPCYDTGKLAYSTLKNAVNELSGDEHAEAWARLETWWAFNSLYQNNSDIPEEEYAYHRANMQWLVDFHTPRATRFSHLVFELNRLLGNYDICDQMIKALTYEEYVRQKQARNQEKGIESTLDEQMFYERYISDINNLKYALSRSPKTFIVNE